MAEQNELGSDLGQWGDQLLGAISGYLKANHSKLAAIEAALAAQAPPVLQPPGGVDRKVTGVKPPVGTGIHEP